MKQKRTIGLFVTLGLCVLVLITFFSIWVYYLSKKQDITNEKSKVSTLTKKTPSIESSSSEETSKKEKASSTTIIFSKGKSIETDVTTDDDSVIRSQTEYSSSSEDTSSSEKIKTIDDLTPEEQVLHKKAENDTRKGVGALLTSQNNTAWMIYTRATGQALSWADFYNDDLVEEDGKIMYDGTTVEYKMLLDCSDIPACGNVYEITGVTEDGE